jgi:hypothetical protein
MLGEYLLLVETATPEQQGQLRQALPANANTTLCQYLELTVTRVAGFTDSDTANSWAQYLTDIGGLNAFVARSPESTPETHSPTSAASVAPVAEATPSEGSLTDDPSSSADEVSSQPTTDVDVPSAPEPEAQRQPMFQPQRLTDGYAVLVSYGDQAQLADQLQALLGQSVGLAVYQSSPYLLAVHTADVAQAIAILRDLSDRQFAAVLVDSRDVVLLTPAVALPAEPNLTP